MSDDEGAGYDYAPTCLFTDIHYAPELLHSEQCTKVTYGTWVYETGARVSDTQFRIFWRDVLIRKSFLGADHLATTAGMTSLTSLKMYVV
jgi:hypothetical protein